MIRILAEEIPAKLNYKLLTGIVVPRPIAFVTTLSTVNESVNAAPFSFFNVASSNPPRISISVGRRDGEMKDTARNAIHRGEFVVHLSDEQLIEEINKTAATLKNDESELSLTSLHTTDSSIVSVPGIKEASIRFECKLDQHLTFQDDQGHTNTDFLIGKVLCYHIADHLYDTEKEYILCEKAKPVARLAGNGYATLDKPFSLDRPS
ncbi:flavin reductase family protein [Bacillus horti]|uniref:Flavin reductase (DIM6/NTAB) family NADH-FMN oxidoreductase RutF n=1 Tax=Caldalkalibacillus horti TaxID=77523 RepID=A0ABT9W3Q7_9BACI|nr:flavin reductase family protein [Bacillus horti]MDQ0167893.1 flavin reductase (DIM6/NTAB) family NADH-FMN oxidoreductase RutF [Bacillus horti]